MTIIYEINPPKIPQGEEPLGEKLDAMLTKLKQRVDDISSTCGGIHITDSVLGTNRVSALTAGKLLKKNHPELQVTISMRVRDRNMHEIEKVVEESISIGLDGILVLMGDPSKNNPKNSGLIPSKVVKHLRESEFDDKTKFFLSLPSNPNFEKIQKKIDAKPAGFMTQVIHSIEQVSRLSGKLRPQGFRVCPCVLLPSEKNASSAEFLNLDWSSYKDNPAQFIKKVNEIAGDVLVTSPSDFTFARETLSKI